MTIALVPSANQTAPPSELSIVIEKMAEFGKKQDETNLKMAEMQNSI